MLILQKHNLVTVAVRLDEAKKSLVQTDGQTKKTVVKQEDAEADIIQPCGKTERRVDIPNLEAAVPSKSIHMLQDRRSAFARRVIVKLQNAVYVYSVHSTS